MKKRAKMILALILAAMVLGGLYAGYMLTSPQYALSSLVKEINQNGITAVEPYLTGDIQSAYSKVMEIVQNPLLGTIMSFSPSQRAIAALANGAGKIKAGYKEVKRNLKEATVTLAVDAEICSGEMGLEMIWEKGKWMIRDISIPIGSWIFQD